jgi:branched-chain amino acid transport system permease protein
MLDMLASQLVNGIVLGMLYVLISVGLTIIFGLLGVVNFAHGAFFALGAYAAYTLQGTLGWWAVILAPFIVGGLGMAVEVLLIRRVYTADPLRSLILTFALALMIEAVIRLVWGGGGQPFSPPEAFSGFVEYGPLFVTNYRLVVFAATLLLLAALWAFLRYTPYGRILRAGSRDPEMVRLLGINLPRVLTGAFGLGIALAGAAGVLAAPLWTVNPTMSQAALLPAFVAIAIGGLGSYAGAIAGGLLIGIVTSLTVQFWPEASSASTYVLMTLVLLIRPRGLFGEAWERFE